MVIVYAVIVGVFSLLLILSPFLEMRPKVQENVRLVSSVLIVTGGVRYIEAVFSFGWITSLCVATVYLLLLCLLTRFIASVRQKRV